MLLKIVYLLTCRVLGAASLVFRGERQRLLKLLVLRHENAVLRRHVSLVRYDPADRVRELSWPSSEPIHAPHRQPSQCCMRVKRHRPWNTVHHSCRLARQPARQRWSRRYEPGTRRAAASAPSPASSASTAARSNASSTTQPDPLPRRGVIQNDLSWRIEDVALAHAYALISMHIRYRQSRRRWRAKRLTQSRGGLPADSVSLAGGGRMAVERHRPTGYVPGGAPLWARSGPVT